MNLNKLYRNSFHFCSPGGWINDPNGFGFYGGRYHLFYQHNPNDTKWGSMHWGHAVSEDLLRWSTLPIALAPDRPYDRDGCFSGSAVEDEGRHVLMYTGNRVPGPDDPPAGPNEARQTQCIAVGDGKRYHKLAANPVIGSGLLTAGYAPGDFRDPKLWREGSGWYCIVAAREKHEGGQLLLYTARDLEHWRLVGVAASGGGSFGTMWECPDFFPLSGGEVLVWSPQNVPQRGCRYQNKHSSVYSIGKLDRGTAVFDGSEPREIDFGPDFYAPQSLEAPDGRRIMIAWMQMWERTVPPDELGHGWAGAMTLPRELEVRDGELLQRPLRELEAYRTNPRSIRERVAGSKAQNALRGHCLDLDLVLTPRGAREVGIILKQGRHTGTRISYTPAERRLVLDRARSGRPIVSTAADRPDCSVYCCEVHPATEALSLRIILDRSSCEVFADGGRRVMTATIYAPDESDGVSFFATGGKAEVSGAAWDLRVPSEGAT